MPSASGQSRGEEMKERIEVNPGIHFGKPCVAGTRIPVVSVLELVSEGLSFDQIRRDYYPDLNIEQIAACLHYAARSRDGQDLQR